MQTQAGTFWVRRFGTNESAKIWNSIQRELFGPFHKTQEGDQNLLIAEWLCTYGVVKWEDVIDVKGNELKYTKKNARALFLNDEYFLSLNAELFNDATRSQPYLYDEADEDIEDLKKK